MARDPRAQLPRRGPTLAQRRLALQLCDRYLSGDQRADAKTFIRDPRRIKNDVTAFIDRMLAAHPDDPTVTEP